MSTYELRVYKAAPERMPDLLARFRDHTVNLFAAHGIESVGYWLDAADPDCLVYLLRYDSDADSSWAAFKQDERWLAVRDASEANGPLVVSVESTRLDPVDFSALR